MIQPRMPRPVRSGVAAVEFAAVLPLLMTLLLGMFEISRALQVKECLTNAAHRGTRIGSLPGKTNTQIQAEVDDIMSHASLSHYSVTVLINDQPGDVTNAKRNDKISVSVSIPVSQIFWVTTMFLKSDMTTSETVIMMRQG